MKLIKNFFFALLFVSISTAEANVRIAYIVGLTGVDPNTARELARGVDTYNSLLKQAERQKFKVEIIDNQGSVEKTLAVMQAAYDSGIRYFIGVSSSNEAIAAAKFIVARPDTMFITPFATNPKVTEITNRVFRVCYDDNAQGSFLAKYVSRILKPQRILILTNIESLYSQGLSEVFKNSLQDVEVKTINYFGSSIEESKLIRAANEFQPDVLFIPDAAQTSAKVVKILVQHLPDAQYVGGDGWGGNTLFHAILPKTSSLNLSYTTYWHASLSNKYNNRFKAAYSNAVKGQMPTSGAALSFEALEILHKALTANNYTQDVNKIRDYIQKSIYESTTGPLNFTTGGGTPARKIVVMKLDKSLVYKSHIYDL